MRRTTPSAAILACLLALAAPGAAQTPAARTLPLAVRMRGFLGALNGESRVEADADSLTPFFPRKGEWERVVTIHRGPCGDTVEVQHFRTAQMQPEMSPDGVLFRSFNAGREALGPPVATVADEARERRGAWRRVRGSRFVAPGRAARSPVFVEWKREDGEWVISSIGEEEAEDGPEPPSPAAPPIVRDSARAELHVPPPDDTSRADGKPWFTSRLPIVLDGRRYLMVGPPQQLRAGQVVRFGVVDGVGVYVELETRNTPEVVYVATGAAGTFQPYLGNPASWCERSPSRQATNLSPGYDGVYQSVEPVGSGPGWSYLRFYPNGTVISVSTVGLPRDLGWFTIANESLASGNVIIRGSHLQFSVTDGKYPSVDYAGTAVGDRLYLHVRSHINGYRSQMVYVFVPGAPGTAPAP